jgi:hypothetical protein
MKLLHRQTLPDVSSQGHGISQHLMRSFQTNASFMETKPGGRQKDCTEARPTLRDSRCDLHNEP